MAVAVVGSPVCEAACNVDGATAAIVEPDGLSERPPPLQPRLRLAAIQQRRRCTRGLLGRGDAMATAVDGSL